MNFCNQHGLRPGDLKTADLAGQSLEGTGLLLEREQANNLGAKSVETGSEEHPGHTVGRVFTLIGVCLWEEAFMETPLQEQK